MRENHTCERLPSFSSPRCFPNPQSGSDARFVPQQNSPIPSPYTPQSPIDYMPYNSSTYSQHQQSQQGDNSPPPPVLWQNCVQSGVRLMRFAPLSVFSLTGRARHIRDNKVSGQLSSKSSNHNIRPGEDYVNSAHRLGNEVFAGWLCDNGSRQTVAAFPLPFLTANVNKQTHT